MTRPGEPTVGALISAARERLAKAPFAPEPREAALLLGHALGLSEAQVLARRPMAVDAAARSRFADLLARRLSGEPVAYLFGAREFYGRSFSVDRRVLIPRPETEHLVEAALALDLPPAPRIVDVGTGSGCIAVTLALEIAGARVVGVDREMGALRVAAHNQHRLGARVALLCADVVEGLALSAIDLLVSNPPYVAPEAAAGLSPEVHRFEPHAALFAPCRGRAVLTKLLDAAARLRPGTPTLLEIGYDQSDWLRLAVGERRGLELERVIRDYGGIDRTAVLRTVSH